MRSAPGFARHFQAVGLEIEGDQQSGVLEPRRRHHPQSQRPAASNDHRIAQLDLAALDGVDGACQRLDIHRLAGAERGGHLVVDGVRREAHVFCHGARGALAEAVDIVLAVAHPVLAALAETAFPAGHDLLGDRQVA